MGELDSANADGTSKKSVSAALGVTCDLKLIPERAVKAAFASSTSEKNDWQKSLRDRRKSPSRFSPRPRGRDFGALSGKVDTQRPASCPLGPDCIGIFSGHCGLRTAPVMTGSLHARSRELAVVGPAKITITSAKRIVLTTHRTAVKSG